MANQNLIEPAKYGLENFFLAIVKKPWTKELEDEKIFFNSVFSHRILEHLRSKCIDVEPAETIGIQIAMMSLWEEDPVVPAYIVRTEDGQKKADQAGHSINNNWLVDVASNSFLAANTFPI